MSHPTQPDTPPPLGPFTETSGNVSTDDGTSQNGDDGLLLDLYKIHVDEYRYNVSLTWERTKFLLTLNSTLTVAGLTLFRFADEAVEYAFLAAIFILTILTSLLSVRVAIVGKQYYRNARRILKVVEQRLGLYESNRIVSGLGIATTETMANTDHSISHPDERLAEKGPSITRFLRVIFYVLIAVNLIGMAIAVYNSILVAGITSQSVREIFMMFIRS